MKKIPAILAIAALSVGFSALALPAQAAPPALPEGDSLVNLSCDETLTRLFTVDAATGGATAAGEAGVDNYCGYSTSWDVTTGTLYGFTWDEDPELYTFDLTTGAATLVADILDAEGNEVGAYTMAIGVDGEGYVYGASDSGYGLYSLELSTGLATLLGPIENVNDAYGFAVDPQTGVLYLLNSDGDLFQIDPLAVSATPVASWTFTSVGYDTYGLAIDNAGTAWVVEYPGEGAYSALYSTPLATFGVDPQLSGNIVDVDTSIDYSSWWVSLVWPADVAAPAPALAATGFDAAPLALGGILLAAAGVVLVSRRTRHAV